MSPPFEPGMVSALAVDVFGTTVDWRTGVADQVTDIAARYGVELDGGAFADAWRDRYLPAMARVNRGERDWVYLDTLHRESLEELLHIHGVADAFDEEARHRLVRAWHHLPAWDDAVEGLARLRRHYIVAAVSNGGFALLTRLVKAAGLPFDCIISAELARAYKPHPRAYQTVAALLDTPPPRVLMVACHTWDIDGARQAGFGTAFLHRPREKGPHRPADQASDTSSDLTVTGFDELADLLHP
ncbi:haloacid dehalogenase type II [Actinomadura spongiicola]|uniref:Haloacid dehalogenase type II n=1 Tax=Actinomadura spongiicola TaxID=2303421 RepID=A0A372GGX2_9ACTN|nr:haloacid dehalogenase type II [Actinomadura spongiicola]RFS84624.1 haloacid dehalogenase type II [Actinomadura spongiicola]